MATQVPLQQLPEALKAVEEQFLKRFLSEMANRLVTKTPVKTGRARASNMLSITGQQAHDALGNEDPGGGRTIQEMVSTARRVDIDSSDVFFTNGVEYAHDLERGSSRQAPSGFMLRTALEADQIAAEAARRTR